MVAFPPCKINLGLHIVERRNDGYHNIETCFYPVPWCDILEVIPGKTISFTNTGLQIPGKPEENLCLRAYELLASKFSLPPVAIHLHKIIPMGAGLGGGSSDAAHVLILLNQIFELKLPVAELATHAAQLGSDCPFFIYNQAMTATSRGEVLEPLELSLKGRFIVIVKPGINISTAEAYKNVVPAKALKPLREIVKNTSMSAWKDQLVNDFEKSVFKKHSEIKGIKDALYAKGAIYASMSGSGSAVFGLFDTSVELKSDFPNTLYWSGTL